MNYKKRKKIAFLCVLGMVITMLFGNRSPFCKTAKAIVGVFSYGGVTYERSLKDHLFYAVKYEPTEEYPTLEMPPSLWNTEREERYVIGGIKENLFENYCFQSVKIHTQGVYTIGANAFKNASTIGDFTVSGDVSKVSANAFQNLSWGGNFKMSGSIDIAEESSFEGIQSKHLSIGKMRIIGDRAFANSCLQSISFSSEVQSIGSKAYMNCNDLQTITLPASTDYLTEVAEDAFPNNEGLVVIIPAGCEDITPYHFENYSNFTFELDASFTTEDTVYKQLEAIGANIRFAEQTEPTVTPTATPTVPPTATPEVTKEPEPTVVPTATPTVPPTATPEVTKEPEPTVTPTATPEVTKEPEPTVTPTATPTIPPTAIPEVTKEPEPTVTPTATPTALPEATRAQELTVTPGSRETFAPSYVKPLKIGDTFVWKGLSYRILNKKQVACRGAVSRRQKVVVIPGTVKYHGITYSVTKISTRAFYNMRKLERVTIGNRVRIIEKSSFEKCKKLKKVIFGKSVTTLKSGAFYLDTNLKVLDFSGKNLVKVGRRAFSRSKAKKTVLVPKGVKKMKYYRLLQKSIV